MESKKRERSANFNNIETQLLVRLIEKYKESVENKKNDSVSNRNKLHAWRKIESSFNSSGISTRVRSWKTLKLKYEGLKKNIKKKAALQAQQMYREPPRNPLDFSDIEEKVISMSSDFKDLETSNDCDSITILDLNDSFDQDIYCEDDEHQKECDHPDILTSGESDVSRTEKPPKTSNSSKLEKLRTARLELICLKMETAKKEQQYMEEQHKLKMLHLANDEKRKQEIHELTVQKINSGHVSGAV